MTTTFKQWIARALIVCLINPALFIQPALARDTAIYTGFLADANSTVKNNVLFLLDTSDSMNLPEGWREYEGAYDSHVEYLWNELERIVDADAGSAGEYSGDGVTVIQDRISTAKAPTQFYTKWGYWAGATLAERRALWQAARNSAKATESGDPDPRYVHRNYDDLSWIYWLPAGTAETDPRLRAPAWNKFRGYIKELGDGAGGSQLRGGPSYTDAENYQFYNQCGKSLDALTPSTVFVPSAVARNSGKYTGQQWARWDPYLVTTPVGVSGYPGSSAVTYALGNSVSYTTGYLNTSSPSTGNPATNPVYRDNYQGYEPVGGVGLPIRNQTSSTGAGWDGLKADAGGFVLRGIIDGFATQVALEQVISLYGLPATTDVDSSGATNISDAKFIAWKGNRDSSPAFGKATGVHAYYDTTAATCDSATGPASSTCLDKPSGTTSANFTLTKNATCNLTGATSEISTNSRVYKRGGTCAIGTVSNSGTDSNGTTVYPSFSDVPSPTVCPAPSTTNSTIRTEDNSGCARASTTVSAATTCSLVNNQQLTIGACQPSGGTAVNVAQCQWSGQSTDTVAACAWSGRQIKTVGTCAWSGRSASYTEGVGWFASGGSCQENASATYCSASAGSIGPYTTQAAALAATAGCANSVASGSYQYGGSCSENSSSEECAISGGSSVLGAGYANVNATCSNAGAPAAGSYKYNGSCTENGSALSCQITGGTSLSIRGTTRTYNQTCSNKADASPVKNAQGAYYKGQTCTGTNNTCSTKTSGSFTVRGTSYSTATSCNSTLTAGTYNRGGSCSGTNVPCSQVTPYGGTSVVSGGNTWYANQATCTAPSGPQSYYSSCTGTKVSMATDGTLSTLNNTPTACNFTTNTLTINGTPYTNYDSCSDKSDVNTSCLARYGVNCQTGCGDATPTSVTGGATAQQHNYYRTYQFNEKADYLVHDCKADDAGSKYMHYTASTPHAFASGWSDTASYASNAVGGVAASDAQKVDMYSANYLNWKFGPKGPNGHPIGRKTRLQTAKDVLADVIRKVNGNGLRVGLMAFNQLEKDIPSGASSGNSSGAHLVKAVVDLTDSSRASLISRINELSASSATPLTESLYESYRYFRGDTPMFGGASYQAKESSKSTESNRRYVTEGIDTSADALVGGAYKSPITHTCQSSLVILVSDGAPENDTSANASVTALPDVGGVSITQGTSSGQFEVSAGVPYGPADPKGPPVQNNYVLLDELANYMAHVDARSDLSGDQFVDLSVVSFGVDAPVLDKAAQVGKGNAYSANDAATLQAALEEAINAISQWQPQGTAPATTYNVTTGASGEIYLSAFSPSGNSTWPGTIKKYKFGFGTTTCGDATCGNPDVCITGNPAITYGSCGSNVEYVDYDETLGIDLRKVRSEAVSYWIPVSPPDGGSGAKGGTGQMLIASGSPPTRQISTFLTGGVSTSTVLSQAGNLIRTDNTNITTTRLGLGDTAADVIERESLIGFAQGSNGAALSSWRSWPSYDSVHSVPVVDGSTLYYLTSDGVMHAINTATGAELWAFMVEEGLAQISAFKANLVGEHIEVADGSPVLATTVNDKRLLIFGMRRGGRAYYALDVTNPSAPLFAWKITPSQICTGTTCANSSSYSELAQTWSKPTVGFVRGYKDTGADAASTTDDKFKPVLIFGGGYDTNQDLTTPGTDSKGRAVFVADAASGSLIRKFNATVSGLGYSIPADVLALDTTGDAAGTLDRAYVGDMGGRLWRMDLDDRTVTNDPANWSIVRLADLATTTRPIKLFNQPTMAPSTFGGQVFDAVFVGGGDTQRPIATGTYDSGAMFMVKDLSVAGVATQAAVVPSAATSGTFVDITDRLPPVMPPAATAEQLAKYSEDKKTFDEKLKQDLLGGAGYVLNLENGEKVTSAAQVYSGQLYFGTYYPSQTAAAADAATCRVGGYGVQYAIDALTGVPQRNPADQTPANNVGWQNRAYGFVSGLGVGLNPVSGGVGIGVSVANRQVKAQKVSTGVRVYWYSVPER